jgi:hypothetical protein
VDTKIDVLQYAFGKRAEHWKELYNQIRKEILANAGSPSMAPCAEGKPPYFFNGMEENKRALIPSEDNYPFKKITT